MPESCPSQHHRVRRQRPRRCQRETENRSWQEEMQDEKREEEEEEEEILLARENLVNWNVSRFRRASVGFACPPV